MKISVIAPSEIPALRANTIQVMKMAQAFVELGHSVRLISPRSAQSIHSIKDDPTWDELAYHYGLSHPFEIEWLPAHPDMRRYDFSLRALSAANRTRSDLIFTRLPQAAAIASKLGKPAIFELHDIPQGSLGPWLLRMFMRGSGKRRLVVITRALLRDLETTFRLRFEQPFTLIAPDGVDTIRYDHLPAPREARQALKEKYQGDFLSHLDPETLTIGYSGHLYPGRGIQLLLDLAENLPQFTFLIAGGEPEQVSKHRQKALAKNLKNIILTGFIPNADLPLFQAACDFLLIPYEKQVSASSGGDISRYLSPMKLFEYLACERPIISSDLPVLREVLNQENCILVSEPATNAWVQAITTLLENPCLASSLASRARKDAEMHTWVERARAILDGVKI